MRRRAKLTRHPGVKPIVIGRTLVREAIFRDFTAKGIAER
jgi:hypothetical protein